MADVHAVLDDMQAEGLLTLGLDTIELRDIGRGANDVFGIAYSGGDSFIFVDLDGDGHNIMLIRVTGIVNVSDVIWSTPPRSSPRLRKS
ncbi:MAG: hypothetical protein EON96_07700 [Caulobacteraceae bacterium]|nr:MAG: hypothetical protein EON96_07700 [Caulobacteraceae bacterium]